MNARVSLLPSERSALEHTLSLYAAVVADLRDVLAHGWLTHAELAAAGAPLLEGWRVIDRAVPALAGHTPGPDLLPGWPPSITTSPLHALGVTSRVARTQSRWYRLGEPGGAQ